MRTYRKKNGILRTYVNGIRKKNPILKEKRISLILRIKEKGCSFCGYKEHTEILNFHHIRDKKFTIADVISRNHSLKSIIAETEKCILLCPNCHYWLHYKERKNGENIDNGLREA